MVMANTMLNVAVVNAFMAADVVVGTQAVITSLRQRLYSRHWRRSTSHSPKQGGGCPGLDKPRQAGPLMGVNERLLVGLLEPRVSR